MSIFTRPPSPPPRQPSPEPGHTPLPSPHVRARVRTLSPAVPPGLHVPKPRKSILTVRSCNDLPSAGRALPARSLPSPSRSAFAELPHRRTLSNAIPYRSPPPSPILASPPPPVPPIPEFALSAKHCPRPGAIMPIHLPDLDSLPPLTEETDPPPPSRKQSKQHKIAAAEKAAMTCLRFFSLRNNSKRRTPAPPSVA